MENIELLLAASGDSFVLVSNEVRADISAFVGSAHRARNGATRFRIL